MSLTIPAFTLPASLARIGRHLPQWPHAAALCLALNAAARLGVLPEDELAFLEGKHFAVEVTDSGGTARFGMRDGWFMPDFGDISPDLCFRAKLAAYLQLLNRQEDPDTLFFQRALVVEGDTELGLRVKNMLDAVDWIGLEWGGDAYALGSSAGVSYLKPRRPASAKPIKQYQGAPDRPKDLGLSIPCRAA